MHSLFRWYTCPQKVIPHGQDIFPGAQSVERRRVHIDACTRADLNVNEANAVCYMAGYVGY